jgi:hypothetical protein
MLVFRDLMRREDVTIMWITTAGGCFVDRFKEGARCRQRRGTARIKNAQPWCGRHRRLLRAAESRRKTHQAADFKPALSGRRWLRVVVSVRADTTEAVAVGRRQRDTGVTHGAADAAALAFGDSWYCSVVNIGRVDAHAPSLALQVAGKNTEPVPFLRQNSTVPVLATATEVGNAHKLP